MKINYIRQANYGTIQNYFYVLEDNDFVQKVNKFELKDDITYVGFGQWMTWLDIPNKINLYKRDKPITLEVLLKNSSIPYKTIKDKLLGLKSMYKLVVKNEVRQQQF